MSIDLTRVGIIGGGPAGCTLAHYLRAQGSEVTIFDRGKRPDLIVGESLIPAIIPLLQELGLEDTIREFSVKKPGASMFFADGLEWRLAFSDNGSIGEHYAYNVPRKEFDLAFQQLAEESGARIVRKRAILKLQEDETVQLQDESPFSFIIDASGRTGLFSSIMKIPSTCGNRHDVALFAHMSEAHTPHGGNIHMGVLPADEDCDEVRWFWCIPLPNRTSVGIVAPSAYLERFGSSNEEQFDRLFREQSFATSFIPVTSKRLSKVLQYNNYQFACNTIYGNNWALVGDAAGFIDPVFSSGTYLSLWGAKSLAQALLSDSLEEYQVAYHHHLASWRSLIESFYDGQFFALIRAGEHVQDRALTLIRQLISHVVTGVCIRDKQVMEDFQSILTLSTSMPLMPSVAVES